MIRIDHISFEFTVPDEAFAHGLYADWEAFCRDCFEQVVEECLADYDRDKVVHVLEQLDLDLGSIPEEDFPEEFPRRLRAELMSSLSSLGTPENGILLSEGERTENLLFFLEHGYPMTEWADTDFDVLNETEWLMAQPPAVRDQAIRNLALLCLRKDYVLRRLLLQGADGQALMGIYSASIAEASAGTFEKRRLLALLLEKRPRIPLDFIHRAENDEVLRNMSELLDGTVVGGIMRTETEEHAEVDIPAYWHYLYEWLIQYYPYNGLAIFGGKAEFVRHLHHRLLAFIRKRGGSPYLSKIELTEGFLLEVFGAAYYRDVLNSIYRMQPRNADGSPSYDGYLNLELYRTFMRLSLLELPDGKAKEKDATQKRHVYTGETYAFLQGNDTSVTDKRALLEAMARQRPEQLLEWIRTEASESELQLLSELADDCMLDRLTASVSFTALDMVERVRRVQPTDRDDATTALVSHLQKILSDTASEEAVKQRAVALFWEAYRTDYAEAIILLQSRRMLSAVIKLTVLPVKEEIIRHRTILVFGAKRSVALLPLFIWLAEHEMELPCAKTKEYGSLAATLLYWLATQAKEHPMTEEEAVHSLFSILWNKGERLVVVKRITEAVDIQEDTYGFEAVLAVLGDVKESVGYSLHERNDWQEKLSNAVQTAFKKRWNTVDGFVNWLKESNITSDYKRELLRTAVIKYTQEWMSLLRNAAKSEGALDAIAEILPIPVLRQGMAKVNFYQASVLTRTMERLEHDAGAFPFLTANGMSLSSALSKALLRYMQDADTLGRTLTEKEIIGKFLACLYQVYKGETSTDYREDNDWRQLDGRMMTEAEERSVEPVCKQGIWEMLSNHSLSATALQSIMERQSGEYSDWMELLVQTDLPEELKKRLLRHFLAFHPKELSAYIRRSVEEGSLPLERWTEWLDASGWLSLATSLSLSIAELLRQVTEALRLDERTQRQAWGIILTTEYIEKLAYDSMEETVRSFVRIVASMQGQGEAEVDVTVRNICKELHINEKAPSMEEDSPEIFIIGNAGLCLIAPWLVRLFGMLGYLDGEKKRLKDEDSKKRALFLLQYIAYGEEWEYREEELLFNRLLTGLPWNIPLQKGLPLTEEEKQTADSMVAGVKANWPQMKGTSVEGFRKSFIARRGTLERQEKRWLLTVDKQAYDILLDSVPWGFRQIRLPWLGKYIQVVWNEKQEFG